jgi:cold shock protein
MFDEIHATVKYYNSTRGFGFVRLADGREIFVHASVLKRAGLPHDATLEAGRSLSVEIEPGPDGRLRVSRVEL